MRKALGAPALAPTPVRVTQTQAQLQAVLRKEAGKERLHWGLCCTSSSAGAKIKGKAVLPCCNRVLSVCLPLRVPCAVSSATQQGWPERDTRMAAGACGELGFRTTTSSVQREEDVGYRG